MTIKSTLRYPMSPEHVRVFNQPCYLRCLVSLKASFFLVCECLVVALMVDWDGLPVCWDVY